MSYKLSYTAQEVDELLGKVKGGVCLPVVELSTEPTAEGAALTAEESAALTAIAADGLPVLIKFTLSGVPYHFVFGWTEAFIASFGKTMFVIEPTDSGWKAMVYSV